MNGTFTYYSVHCSNYGVLFAVLMHHHIPFEWHSKNRSKMCYADFCLDNERDPSLDDILAEGQSISAHRGKKFGFHVMSKYIV